MPPNCTTEQGTKESPFIVSPFTVSVNVGECSGTEVGVPTAVFGGIGDCEIESRPGPGRVVAGVVVVNGMVFDVPEAVATVTPVVPGNAASDAEIAAVSSVELTK